MTRGKIITIEGTDGTGKSTQKDMLVKRAEGAGYQTFSMKFPDYSSKWGGRVKQYLRGEFGDVVNPMHASIRIKPCLSRIKTQKRKKK
jgi:dTMP kinase